MTFNFDQYDSGLKIWQIVSAFLVRSEKYGVKPAALPSDALNPGEVNIWLDEAGNTLVFQVKYSTGTVKNGTVALT